MALVLKTKYCSQQDALPTSGARSEGSAGRKDLCTAFSFAALEVLAQESGRVADQAMRIGTEARSGNARSLRVKAENQTNAGDGLGSKQKSKPKSRKETPLQGQSSEKSSQDRLSVPEKEDVECWPGEAPTSSLSAGARLSPDSGDQHRRLSSLRTRSRAAKPTVSADASPKCENSTDPDWSPTASPRHEEAVSCSPAEGEASIHQAGSSKALDMAPTRASVEAACRQAQIKKHAAAELVAVARSLALEASRACKRQRVQPKLSHRASSSSSPFLGARVAVYWPNDKQFYKGKVISVKGDGYDYQIEYDDLWTEWLCLSNERFRLVGPRAVSAGCNDALLEQLQSLEAEGLHLAENPATPCQKPAEPEPSGEAALGWKISVFCRADSCSYEGQLIAHKPSSNLHHILYQDGEDEWLCLQQEQIQWMQHLDRPSPAGLKPGESAPVGEEAIGWQISVYWRASCQFLSASVTFFNSEENQHLVTYSNGDEEHICLASQCIKYNQVLQSKQTSSSGELKANPGSDRKWTFKTSKPRSSRMASAKRQSSWGNLNLEAKDGGGCESGRADRGQGDSPVSGIFEYVGPSPDKLPMLLGRHSSLGYLADADKGPDIDSPLDSSSVYKAGLLSPGSDLQSFQSKLSSQALCPVDGGNPWRMGSPFRGLELPEEGTLPSLSYLKSEADCEGRLGLQLEEKFLGGIDRPSTAPSPVPLLENVSHPPFSDSLLVGEPMGCHPSLHNNMGSGHISSDSLEGSDDYLDIHALMEMPADNPPSDWFTLQPL